MGLFSPSSNPPLHQDIPYMDLSGDDLVPDRAHVFHIRFPKEWKTGDIIHIFQVLHYE